VARRRERAKRAAAREGHREEQLVGEMATDRDAGRDVFLRLCGHLPRHLFGRHTPLAEGCRATDKALFDELAKEEAAKQGK
jgi:hypothetical protein